ncbi:MAG: hypothetical protein FJ280_09940 [Planctomycetes bacterium]|nr:hypothetical protein [Planctomycetota bacterium]
MIDQTTTRVFVAISRALRAIMVHGLAQSSAGKSMFREPIQPPDEEGNIRFAVDMAVIGLATRTHRARSSEACCKTFADYVGTALVHLELKRFQEARAAGMETRTRNARHAGFGMRFDTKTRTAHFSFHESLIDHIGRPFAVPPSDAALHREPNDGTVGWMRDLPDFLKREPDPGSARPAPSATERQPASRCRPVPIPISLRKRMGLFPFTPVN